MQNLSWPAVNSVEDWCIFGPPNPGAGSSIGNIEASRVIPFSNFSLLILLLMQRIAVAWCTKVFLHLHEVSVFPTAMTERHWRALNT